MQTNHSTTTNRNLPQKRCSPALEMPPAQSFLNKLSENYNPIHYSSDEPNYIAKNSTNVKNTIGLVVTIGVIAVRAILAIKKMRTAPINALVRLIKQSGATETIGNVNKTPMDPSQEIRTNPSSTICSEHHLSYLWSTVQRKSRQKVCRFMQSSREK